MSKNAILLFSKVPEEGKVKTRLTPIKDGKLHPAKASYLYHCMLFDVCEICCDALRDLEELDEQFEFKNEYEIIISSPGEQQRQAMEELFAQSGAWPRSITFISDEGKSFDEHYNHAFSQVWDKGFDTILSMGCDMPALERAVVIEGIARLQDMLSEDKGGIVLSPDQEMGVSIVGWTRKTKFDHTGVFYNKTGLTVLPAYIEKAQAAGLPVQYLPAVPDVDTMLDLMHNITLVQAMEYCSQFQDDLSYAHRTAEALKAFGLDHVRVAPNDLMDPRDEIDK